MTAHQLALVLQSTVCIAIFLILVFRLWPAHRCDSFRQNMFAIRDRAFDYAASGKIAFDHPSYRLLRQSMNGYIRYAHRLTFFRLCLTVLHWKVLGQTPELKWVRGWEGSLKTLPPDVQQDLLVFHGAAMRLVIKHVVTGSPVLLLLLGLTFILQIGQAGWRNLRKFCYDSSAHVVSIFIDPRLVEEDAARMAA